MAVGILRDYLEGRRARVLWIEFDQYAHRVFANGAPDWLTQPTRFANTMVQARKAVRTDVLCIDIAAAGLASVQGNGSPAERCRTALTDPVAHRYVTECLDAVLHKLAGDVDIVLRSPAPRDLYGRCGGDGDADFDALDDIGSVLTEVLRGYSDRPLAGLLLTRAAAAPIGPDEADALDPVLNAARHYGWITSLSISEALLRSAPPDIAEVDLLLCGEASRTDLATMRAAGRACGGGISAASWRTGDHPAALAHGELAFGEVPPETRPETVLAFCEALART